MKLKAFFEAAKLSAKARKSIARLFEADVMKDETEIDPLAEEGEDEMPPEEPPVDAPPPEAAVAELDPMDALRQGFRAACMSVLDDEVMPAQEKLAKLKELLTTAEKLAPKNDAPAPALEAEEPEEEENLEEGCDEDEKKVEESRKLRRRVKELEARESVRELCEAENVKPSAELVEALALLPTDAKRKALLGTMKSGGKPLTETKRPRTQVPSGTGKGPADDGFYKNFLETTRATSAN